MNIPKNPLLRESCCEGTEAGIDVWEGVCFSIEGAKEDGVFKEDSSEGVRETFSGGREPMVGSREEVDAPKASTLRFCESRVVTVNRGGGSICVRLDGAMVNDGVMAGIDPCC